VPLALQYYQRGLETRGQRSIEQAEQGAALFREATRIDPQFADAWGALAWSYRGLLEYGPRPDAERLRSLCRSAAARALELDRDNAEARAALLLLGPYYRRWLEIERGCTALLKERPRNSILEYNLAYTLSEVGRFRESIPLLRSVAQRERFWPLPHLELLETLFVVGRTEEAEDLLEEGMKRFPRRVDYWVNKIHILMLMGRYSEALAFINDPTRRPADASDAIVDYEVTMLEALAKGSRVARDAAVERLKASANGNPVPVFFYAMGIGLLGHFDTSFSMLEGYFFGRGPWGSVHQERLYTGFLFGRMAAPLRSDSRFESLVREIGLTDYWRASHTRPDYVRSG
jgi:tetratricopeptide (TPR) repeat protein